MEVKKSFSIKNCSLVLLLAGFLLGSLLAFQLDSSSGAVSDLYSKFEHMVPMRDGVELFTSVYIPKGDGDYPILMKRTPYSVRPYGEGKFPTSLGPSSLFMEDGYIFVYQDVRGKYMSGGEFVNMRPHRSTKESDTDIDESSDTWDTINWLLENIPEHNGKVGMWGISYPGFYAAAGMIDAHPALRAVSPQAPIADWFFDDFHHHGAFFLAHSFNFLSSFGWPRPEPTTEGNSSFDHGTPDGYDFFLGLGSLDTVNSRHFEGNVAFWKELAEHPNYDEFWQARNLLPHIRNLPEAVLTVGGWFDAEDLFGPLNIYRTAEKNKVGGYNGLVMGPWSHGLWASGRGDHLGNIYFGSDTSEFYREHIEFPFFSHYLKGREIPEFPEAWMFETGRNEWCRFEQWPPSGERKFLYLAEGFSLDLNPPGNEKSAWDEYINDPSNPVPFTEEIDPGMTNAYMTDDQRFADRRPDVLAFSTPVLDEDLTLAGPVLADLWVSTSGSSADWVVKVIDVFPDDQPDPAEIKTDRKMGGYQMMVRSEVIRGRFRNSYEHPEPFEPNVPARVRLPLQDVLHTFKVGHRVMVQVQSTWFPLVDRNPGKYMDNIFEASEEDFIKTTQRVYRSSSMPSHLEVNVLRR
ncbi:MAG: CocE/NonD family hydrolase [Acidobacteriota bacterium]